MFPGNCWAFEGDKGQVVIRLPGHVQLSDITLQHPPPTVAHTGGASSAPRDFAVFVSGAEARRWGILFRNPSAVVRTIASICHYLLISHTHRLLQVGMSITKSRFVWLTKLYTHYFIASVKTMKLCCLTRDDRMISFKKNFKGYECFCHYVHHVHS